MSATAEADTKAVSGNEDATNKRAGDGVTAADDSNKKAKTGGSDATTTTTTPPAKKVDVDASLAAKILKQVDFYFSDSNFPRDNFLRGEAAKDVDGYVSLQTILTFKRMQQLTTDIDVLANSITESDIVELDADQRRIRRRHAVIPKDASPRTIYSKSYPKDTQWEAIEQFWSAMGEVAATRLHRDEEHNFNGAVYVEFVDSAAAEKAVKENPSFNGVALTTMTKKDYINTLPPKEKSKEKSGANEYKGMRTEKGKNRQDKKRKNEDGDGKADNAGGDSAKADDNAAAAAAGTASTADAAAKAGDDTVTAQTSNKKAKKAKTDKSEKKAESESKAGGDKDDSKAAGGDADDNDDDNADDGNANKEDKDALTYTAGCIVTVKGIGKISSRDELQSKMEPFGGVHIDYGDNSEFGHVRFQDPSAAKACMEAFADGKRELFGKVATVTLMQGDEEREYWQKIMERGKAKQSQRGGRGGRARGGRGRGRGGRGGGRGGKKGKKD